MSAFRSRPSVLLALGLGLGLLLRTATASANPYLPTADGESWTYVSDRGAVVESHIGPRSGGWTRFSQFLNRSNQWVWTSPTNDRIYLWDVSGPRLLVNFATAGSPSIDLGCTPATLRIEAMGSTLAVPAGTFADVIWLRITAPCMDAGITDIWFARGVGIIQYSENTWLGNVTFKMVRGPSVDRLDRLPAAARDTYDAISRNLAADVRTAIDGLPQTVLLDHTAFAMMDPPELSIALPYAIRDALAQQGIDSLSDAEVDRLALVVAVDLVDLVDLIAEQEMTTELAMINLQSANAARGQSLELIDNMLESFASSTSSIIGEIQ